MSLVRCLLPPATGQVCDHVWCKEHYHTSEVKVNDTFCSPLVFGSCCCFYACQCLRRCGAHGDADADSSTPCHLYACSGSRIANRGRDRHNGGGSNGDQAACRGHANACPGRADGHQGCSNGHVCASQADGCSGRAHDQS